MGAFVRRHGQATGASSATVTVTAAAAVPVGALLVASLVSRGGSILPVPADLPGQPPWLFRRMNSSNRGVCVAWTVTTAPIAAGETVGTATYLNNALGLMVAEFSGFGRLDPLAENTAVGLDYISLDRSPSWPAGSLAVATQNIGGSVAHDFPDTAWEPLGSSYSQVAGTTSTSFATQVAAFRLSAASPELYVNGDASVGNWQGVVISPADTGFIGFGISL